jgi:hypothetical protein
MDMSGYGRTPNWQTENIQVKTEQIIELVMHQFLLLAVRDPDQRPPGVLYNNNQGLFKHEL